MQRGCVNIKIMALGKRGNRTLGQVTSSSVVFSFEEYVHLTVLLVVVSKGSLLGNKSKVSTHGSRQFSFVAVRELVWL